MSDQPFAQPTDVERRMTRSLTAAETDRAQVLCEDASDMIRVRWPDVDDRLTAGTLRAATVLRVVAQMVRRALLNPASEGVTQQSQTAGQFAQSATYANPEGALYVTKAEADTLGPEPAGNAGNAFTIRVTPTGPLSALWGY